MLQRDMSVVLKNVWIVFVYFIRIVETILKISTASINEKCGSWTALHCAVYNSHQNIVEVMWNKYNSLIYIDMN